MRALAETVIDRPMEAVWRWAADPAHWGRWEEDMSGIAPGDYEIAESTAPRRQVIRSVAARPPFESILELSEDIGGTRVRRTVDAAPGDALTRIAFIAARPLARRDMRRRIEDQLARLKEMVELEAAL
jgi:hypothetical protein